MITNVVPKGDIVASVLIFITPGGGGFQLGTGSTGLKGLGGDKVSKKFTRPDKDALDGSMEN